MNAAEWGCMTVGLLLAGFAALVAVSMPAFAAVAEAVVLIMLICTYISESSRQYCADHGHNWQRKGCQDVCAHCFTTGALCHDVNGSDCVCQRCHKVAHDFQSWNEVVGGHYGSNGEGQTWYVTHTVCRRCGEAQQGGVWAGP
jgi:hypothetical protein